MHDPAMLVSVFEGDEKSEMGNSTVTAFAQSLMNTLQEIFANNSTITISNEVNEKCPDLEKNLEPEQAKVSNVPATIDTRIYVVDYNSIQYNENVQTELQKIPANNNIRFFIVAVTDSKVIGRLTRRYADANLLSLDKFYHIEREVSTGSNECVVAEQLIRDFLKEYEVALSVYYAGLNNQFPNKICNNVNLALPESALQGEVFKEDGLEDYAGLPQEVRDEIKNYLNEFSQAYGHSIKTYFTGNANLTQATLEGSAIFETLKNKFNNGNFDDASYGIWMHYDDNSGCLYIRHGLNESKVFQESKKSKLTKPADKQKIITEAKKTINDVIANLDSKGTQGWSALASNFKSALKATVGGVATTYDMGRETYETGQTPVRLWDDTKSDQYSASPFHDPTNGIASGGGDAIVAKVMEIPQLVSFGYDIATKEEVRTQLVNTVKEVSWPKIQSAATDFFADKKNKYAGGGNVMMHEASLDVSSVLLELLGGAKILEMLEDLLKKLGKEAREAVVKAIKEKLTDPDQITRFIKDIDGSDELLNAVAKKTDLIDSWKTVDNSPLASKRNDVDFLNKVDEFNAQKQINSPKKTERIPANAESSYSYTNSKGVKIEFDKDGFPDFRNHTPGKDYWVKTEDMTGNYVKDFAIANNAAIKKFGKENIQILTESGSPVLIKTNGEWKKYTWHHHQDGKTMMPVLSDNVHSVTPHTGGKTIVERSLKGLYESPF